MSYYFVVSRLRAQVLFFFFFNDTATTEIYTLSLHDALPIYPDTIGLKIQIHTPDVGRKRARDAGYSRSRTSTSPHSPSVRHEHSNMQLALPSTSRSEEHTSELQSRLHLVCRLLLEKKKTGRVPADDRRVDDLLHRHDEPPAREGRLLLHPVQAPHLRGAFGVGAGRRNCRPRLVHGR